MTMYLTLDQVVYVYEKACDELEERQRMRKYMKTNEFATVLTAAGVAFGIAPVTSKACLLVAVDKVDSIRTVFQQLLQSQLPTITSFPSHMLTMLFEEVEQLSLADNIGYKEALKRVKTYNQTIERQKQHAAAREALDKAIHVAFSRKRHVLVSVDIEWWEDDSDVLLELGWSMWDNHTQQLTSKHWVIDEHVHIRNGKYVPNKKWCFNFGSSIQGRLREGLSALQDDLVHGGLDGSASQDADAVIILVGHGVSGDLKVLRDNDIDVVPKSNMMETQELFWGLQTVNDNQQVSLQNMLKALGIKYSNLHNAGNDARYTMEAFLAMLDNHATSGKPQPGAA